MAKSLQIMMNQQNSVVKKQATLFQSFIPIIYLIIVLSLNVYFFEDTLSGANQIALISAAGVAALVATYLGINWFYVRSRIVHSISTAMPSTLILFLIGSLSGTWMLSGVVPALIYYGLKILEPSIFLFATAVITALVSLGTGSSWSTVATIGVALLGIGNALGFNEAITAGAIVSGAYFGDKMSPLSDTTNLAPAMAGTDLFTHIRYMVITTLPSISITLFIFLIMGFTMDVKTSETDVATVLSAIENTFFITPWLFVVPAILIIIIVKKVPPLPSLFIGTLLGGLFAIIFQPHLIRELAKGIENYASASYVGVMMAMFGDISIESGNEKVNELLSTSGMAGMLNTVWLIISAMIFGGVMESAGLLKRISHAIISRAQSTGQLVTATAGTSIFFNITASDQYISIVVPGKMFAETYRERGYKPELLSRTLEDAGTVTSVLIPWNTCGATQAAVLGVPTLSYLPYAFFNLISPVMTIFVAYINYKIRKYTPEELIMLKDADDLMQKEEH
jgi:NhaC family Na+:H+ antiporter